MQIRTFAILAFSALAMAGAPVHAADDTARFLGTWEAQIPVNGQALTMVSIHDAAGYHNFWRGPDGDKPAGDGGFSAANGKYTTTAPWPNNAGTYRFTSDGIAVCTNAAGATVTWRRVAQSSPTPSSSGSSKASETTARPADAAASPAGANPAPSTKPDPSLSADTNAAIEAFDRKDYKSAWTHFMVAAQSGEAEAQAGVGVMLLRHLNPPGTGFYAQCEKWLLASANQGNAKGMDYLGQYYFERGRAIAGGINPGVNNAAIAPAERQQSEEKFRQARTWFERSAAKGDVYAKGQLAILLAGGVGGPRDEQRAAQLRAEVAAGSDKNFAQKVASNADDSAFEAAWQAGHYADAVKIATDLANKGDVPAQALLAQAYFDGKGVAPNDAACLEWAKKASAANNRDGLYYAGLLYYLGRGVPRDWKVARAYFTRSAKLGKTEAQIKLSDIYYSICKPQRTYGGRDAEGNEITSMVCPSVDLLSDHW